MNDEKDIPDQTEAIEAKTETPAEPIIEATPVPPGRVGPSGKVIIALVSVASLVVVGVVAWIFWPSAAGRAVPVPRAVTFGESSVPESVFTGDQVLTLTAEQTERAGLKFETVGEAPALATGGQMTTGIIQANAYRETPVVSLVGGIVRTMSVELGQNVRRDQRIAMIFSTELADAQAKYLAVLAGLDERRRHYSRTAKLVEIGAASREELEQANARTKEAESELSNLRQKLLLLGLPGARVNSLKSSTQVSSEVVVTAPVTGTVTSRSVNPGQVIEANKELLRVTDLSSVWAVGQVFEKDLALIHLGSGANITSDTYPGRIFRGRVSYVDTTIDPASRTAQVRIELANPGQALKIGMYVNVSFATLEAGAQTTPMVPKDAVQLISNQQIVFVATERPNEFVLRPVRLGPESNGFYPVLNGLNVGDKVVTEGSFLLRAEWQKSHPNQ